VHEGSDLRFLSVWPHLSNPRLGRVILTAQRAQDVVGINGVFHGPTDFVVARGRTILQSGSYFNKTGAWTFGGDRVTQNPRDELAWLRLLKMLPRVGIAISRRVWQHISSAADPFNEVLGIETASLLPSSAQPFFNEFAKLLKESRQIDSPAEIIDLANKRFYDDYLVSHYDNAAMRREDIKALANFAGQYKNVEAFLADACLAGEFSCETCVEGPVEQEFVILSTVHQAKGLEWPVVFISWLADGRFPTDMAMNHAEDLEEERRVFHVAVTRARDEVYLVVPQVYRNRGGSVIMMKPSRFLMEIARDLTEPMELEESLPHLLGGVERESQPQLPAPEGA
jgi:DNA helicase-2/ATP-dependent DNA helicase PcrA